MTILILGGTSEASALAGALAGRDVVTSLAGRTGAVPDLPGRLRVGGFGGEAGLAGYLQAEQIDAVVDATHPFAARISAHAAAACAAMRVRRLVLGRPSWMRQPGDIWIEAESMAQAAEMVSAVGRRAFLTVGIQEAAAFAGSSGVHFLVRLIVPQPLPLEMYVVVAGRGPFSEDDEAELMRTHAIDVVVTKASGGQATYGKIAAARRLGIPVLMIRRPPPPPGPTVFTVAEAVAWLDA